MLYKPSPRARLYVSVLLTYWILVPKVALVARAVRPAVYALSRIMAAADTWKRTG